MVRLFESQMQKLITLYQNLNWLIAILVFASYIIIDGLYAKYTLEVVSLRPMRSASIGAFMHLLLAFGVINYTSNWLYVIPVVIGSWIGTYFVVRREKGKK